MNRKKTKSSLDQMISAAFLISYFNRVIGIDLFMNGELLHLMFLPDPQDCMKTVR